MAISAPALPRPNAARAVLGSIAVTALDASLLALALGGLPALLGHPRALALLAAWYAGGVFLSLLRPVRVHDPVGAAAEPRWTMAALFLVPLAIPPIAALGERLGLWPIPGGTALQWAGVALSAFGLAIRIAAMARLGSRFSPWIAAQRGHAIETGGLYGRVRHPGYLGTCLAALGAVLAFGSALGLLPLALLVMLLDRRIRREEAFLVERFGDSYRSYQARAGRLLPRLGGPRA